MSEKTDLLAAWAAANQACRDRAHTVGVRNCDDDPEWRRLEQAAEAAHEAALAAGHSYAELSEAGRPS
jgi:hypothetical protein